MRAPEDAPEPRIGYPQRLPEYLSLASQFVGMVQAGVKVGQAMAPYLRPLALAAAV